MASTNERPAYGAQATRHRILDAAWDLLARHGDVTLKEVAAAAGVSRQAVYLHVGDRQGLLVAVVRHMDESLGIGESVAEVFAAPSGVEAMHRAVVVHSTFNPSIDPVARHLERASGDDPLAVAWRDRMTVRRQVHHDIVRRIADDGALAPGWTIDAAAGLFHGVTLPAVWRELVELGWDAGAYVEHLDRLLRGAFVVEPRG